MQKVRLQTWSSSCNVISNKVSKLKKDRENCRKRCPEMHLQECLSNYELSIVLISLFAADGTMLHCSAKSKSMASLEKMSSAETSDVATPDILQPNKCVAIIDTMADVQSMDKRSWIKMYKDMFKDVSAHFNAFIQRKYDELHIVFDRYDIPKSLKSATKHLWLGIFTLWHITAQTLHIFQVFH